jgi:hypothetical protein
MAQPFDPGQFTVYLLLNAVSPDRRRIVTEIA